MACKGLRKVVGKCWTTRIRTGNDRTKTCSVTITPSSRLCGCKVSENLAYRQIFTYLSYFTMSK